MFGECEGMIQESRPWTSAVSSRFRADTGDPGPQEEFVIVGERLMRSA